MLKNKTSNTSSLIAEKSGQEVKITHCSTAKKHFSTLVLILLSCLLKEFPTMADIPKCQVGDVKYFTLLEIVFLMM